MIKFCQIAIQMVTRATEEDNKKNYYGALTLYEAGIQYFTNSLECKLQIKNDQFNLQSLI